MRRLLLLTIFTFLATFAGVCLAQSDMIVEHYTTEQGLPNDIVYCSLKDRNGFMWFGTWHGLCSFDGEKFMPFVTRRGRHSDIPPRKVISLVEDGNGFLWIRNVDNRLYIYDKKSGSYHEVYDELKKLSKNVQVIKIQKTEDNHVLILTRNKNLYEAKTDPNGRVTIFCIHDSNIDVNPADMKLRYNVLGETRKYVFWIGIDYKIALIKKTREGRYLSNISRNKRFTYFDHRGDLILAGTSDGSIYSLDMRTNRQKQYVLPALKSAVTCIASDKGKIYVSSMNGFYSISAGNSHKISSPITEATHCFIDKYHTLWLQVKGKALVNYNPQTGKSTFFPFHLTNTFDELIYLDTGSNGLFIILRDGVTWHYDRFTGTMSDINSYKNFNQDKTKLRFFYGLIDKDGLLWLSSTTNGIYKISFPPHSFSFFRQDLMSTPSKTDDQGVRAIYQTKNGELWIGTRWGDVYCLDNHQKVKRYYRGTLGNVYHFMEDDHGTLWMSTKGAGLIKAETDKSDPQGLRMTRYNYDPSDNMSISSDKVYFTFQDSHHRIWACTFGGGLNLIDESHGRTVFHNKNNDFTLYPKYDLFMNVRAMTEDRNGRIWVGTIDGLMSFPSNFSNFNKLRFETYRDNLDANISDNDIYSLYKDSFGDIWIGSFGGGLNRLVSYNEKVHKPIFKSYSITEFPGGNVISSITEDRDHTLWLCTENGLASMRHGSDYLRSYDRFAGFPNVDIEDNTSTRLQNGNILIGCRQGILSFSPTDVKKENNISYNTFIVDFNVLNRNLDDFNPPIYDGSIRFARDIVLQHDQSMFTIEFAALNYSARGHISYKYILEGYEDEWHFSGSNRIASYANVPPGKYTFHVGVIDETTGGLTHECTMRITITPPWWATWWAYTVYTLLIIVLLYGVARMILYMIRMRNEVYIDNRLTELKIRFFTNVSHELRTPLTLINSPIEELKKNEHLSKSGKEYLNLIESNAHKMLQLVNQILDFRKIQNGKMRLHVSMVDINELLDMFQNEFHMLADEHDVAFRFEMPEEHVLAWCDAEKMGIVIRNLLTNAFKFTRKGGTICVALEQDFDDRQCRIKVEDDGVGIPKSQLEMIFERFSQAENKNDDTSYTGTGIGLSLSREYINLHHGKIWAENGHNGKGATFIVEIPTDKEHFKSDQIDMYVDDNTASSQTQPAGTRIVMEDIEQVEQTRADLPILLLIEDNIDLCRMLNLQLQKKYQVYFANDGSEGLKKIYQYHPDVIITDLMMPGIDGMELLRRVRRDFSISHIPIIMLTAKSGEEVQMGAITAGANAFITKPFSSEYLVACINQLLNEQRVFQRKILMRGNTEQTTDEKRNDTYEQHLAQKDIEFVHKIHEVIEKNLNESDFNIDTIAENIGLSRSAFFKKLKSLTGFAPIDLVKEIRLNKAASLIETTDDSISEIAYSVGFRDSGYFGKCFRKKYEMTPKEYRLQKRK
jgi:signal transduction histidine kinase/DNA-binding response OmpR family regulator/ligand-binding sensor domain-containing protein